MSVSPRDQPSPHQQGSAHSPPTRDPVAGVSPSDEDPENLAPALQGLDEEQQQQEEEEGEQPPHPPFEPVFTLLTNATTNTTTHPRVHYVFSDDDPSILSNLDPSRRNILVDLEPSQPSASASPAPAWSVSWAASLSPDFALTSSRLSEQQQDVGGGGVGVGAAGDPMLRLEGVEREPVELKQLQQRLEDSDDDVSPHGRDHGVREDDQDALVEDFRARMGVLQRVIDEARKREVAVAGVLDDEEQDGGDDDDDDDDDEEAVTSGQKNDDDDRPA